MKDGVVFALVLLAAMCAEDIPALMTLVLLAGAVELGGKIVSVWEFGHEKTALGAGTSKSGKVGQKRQKKLSIRRDYTTA